jgi:sec-independent protein translocase protein TatA
MPFGGFGMWEVLLVLLVILLVFGPRRLPELGGALGKGIREFKRAFRDIENELRRPLDEEERKEIPSGARPDAARTEAKTDAAPAEEKKES